MVHCCIRHVGERTCCCFECRRERLDTVFRITRRFLGHCRVRLWSMCVRCVKEVDHCAIPKQHLLMPEIWSKRSERRLVSSTRCRSPRRLIFARSKTCTICISAPNLSQNLNGACARLVERCAFPLMVGRSLEVRAGVRPVSQSTLSKGARNRTTALVSHCRREVKDMCDAL